MRSSRGFQEFLARYRSDTLDIDASWRAYDIEAAVKAWHALKGYRLLGLKYAGELMPYELMARYAIKTRAEADAIAGAWWVWWRVSTGHRVKGLTKRVGSGSGARVVAADPSLGS